VKRRFTVSVLFIIFGLLSANIWGCQAADQAKQNDITISQPRFLMDNDRILFEYFLVDKRRSGLAIYEISSGRLYRFEKYDHILSRQYSTYYPPEGKDITIAAIDYPTFSRDGKQVAFKMSKADQSQSDIYVANADGTNIEKLTESLPPVPSQDGSDSIVQYNTLPSFSPDGKRIMFQRAALKRQRSLGRGKMLSHWDVYDVDIAAGTERRLTNQQFYDMSQPYYLSDGTRFIFSASTISATKEPDLSNIYILDGKKRAVVPEFKNGWYSTEPRVSLDDAVLFKSETSGMDGLKGQYNYDLFIKRGGAIKRITKMQTYIFDQAISPDGSRIVFLENKKREFDWSMWTVNSDGTGLTKIEISWDQLK
jgi:Tol biopolymer transport system component